MTFLHVLVKIFFFPIYLITFRWKKYYTDKFNKTRLNNSDIIIANNKEKNSRLFIFFSFYFQKLLFLTKEDEKSFYHTININDNNFLDKARAYIRKGYKIVVLTNKTADKVKDIDDDYLKALESLNLKNYVTFYSRYQKRLLTNVSLIKEFTNNKALIKKELNFLDKQIGLYKKYHTYDFIDFSWWFYDLTKIFSIIIIPKIYIVFPVKKLYSKEMSKEDKKIRGKALLVSNHNTFLDPFLTTFIVLSRRLRYVAALDALNSSKFLKNTYKLYHSIVLDRESPTGAMSMFKEASDVLSANGVVGIYPEGHVVRTGDEFDEFNSGAALLALTNNAPIYPMVYLKRYQAFKMQYVIFGKPIYPSDFIDPSAGVNEEAVNKLNNYLKEKMLDLKKEGLAMINK